jgi:hypothetical protein
MQLWLAIQPVQRVVTALIIVCILINIEPQSHAWGECPRSENATRYKYANSHDTSMLKHHILIEQARHKIRGFTLSLIRVSDHNPLNFSLFLQRGL